jgi:hypothetical protein
MRQVRLQARRARDARGGVQTGAATAEVRAGLMVSSL